MVMPSTPAARPLTKPQVKPHALRCNILSEVSEYPTKYFPPLRESLNFCFVGILKVFFPKCEQFQVAKFPLVFSQLNKATALAQRKEKTGHLEKWETLCYFSHLLVLSSLDPRIFADEGKTGLPCHTLVPQFCILKSMSCPVAACSFFLIPVKRDNI